MVSKTPPFILYFPVFADYTEPFLIIEDGIIIFAKKKHQTIYIMKRLATLLLLLLALSISTDALAQSKRRTTRRMTTTASTPESKILGKHPISLQWISWDYFGTVEVKKERDGRLHCVGEQRSRENDDYVTVDGYIKMESNLKFYFTGTIITKVYHINNGQPCVREGTFEFLSTQGRQYWRLQQMDNPCDEACDYVDIFFRKMR